MPLFQPKELRLGNPRQVVIIQVLALDGGYSLCGNGRTRADDSRGRVADFRVVPYRLVMKRSLGIKPPRKLDDDG